jgi:hypothetical protein
MSIFIHVLPTVYLIALLASALAPILAIFRCSLNLWPLMEVGAQAVCWSFAGSSNEFLLFLLVIPSTKHFLADSFFPFRSVSVFTAKELFVYSQSETQTLT